MRLILLCAALAAAPAMAGDLVATDGGDTVRLVDVPCTSEQILSLLEPRLHAKYKAASAVVQGRNFDACWRQHGSVIHLLYEDGDEGLVPMADLKPEMTA